MWIQHKCKHQGYPSLHFTRFFEQGPLAQMFCGISTNRGHFPFSNCYHFTLASLATTLHTKVVTSHHLPTTVLSLPYVLDFIFDWHHFAWLNLNRLFFDWLSQILHDHGAMAEIGRAGHCVAKEHHQR